MEVRCQTIDPAQSHRFGKHRGSDACGLVAHQLFAGEHEELRLFFNFFPVPPLKAVTAADIGRQLLIVKSKDQFVIHQNVLASRLVLQILHLLDQFEVRT